ncbi:VOC family protein [Pelagerythrobacter rhizovicinus]|uniref:VOC family protein n=1 Tax=Pelagerythrobacter rhizovicinus TaxID=2268576 RepID=A0A4Q2KRC5_9SPHN|nr:VOC family protein [Pelagerythrobacter rhizovicinus]RXZ65881.1 VOC family protein [Pelagerythrobacter rhizovicinus]
MAEDKGSFIWYELMTPDPAGARAFYREVVGWDIEAESSMPAGGPDYRMIKRSDGGDAGGVLALTDAMCESGARPGWFGYVHVPDVDAAVARIVEAGGTVFTGPHDLEGVGRMAMVADPQGAPIYVMTPTPPADRPDAQSDVFDYEKPQHVRWNELQTTDTDAAVALYTELFGWEQKDKMPMGEMGDYLFIHQGDGMIGAMMPKMPDVPQSVWTYYVGVDDIDRAAKAVADGGGKLLDEIMEIPGGEFAFHCLDPQGAAIGFVGPRKI